MKEKFAEDMIALARAMGNRKERNLGAVVPTWLTMKRSLGWMISRTAILNFLAAMRMSNPKQTMAMRIRMSQRMP